MTLISKPAPPRAGLDAFRESLCADIGTGVRSRTSLLISGPRGATRFLARLIHVVGQRRDPAHFVSTGPKSLDEGLSALPLVEGDETRSAGGYQWTLCVEDVDQLALPTQDLLLYFLSVVSAMAEAHGSVRLIATTTADLHRRVLRGEFREELFYRLNVQHMLLPPIGVIGPMALSSLLNDQARVLLGEGTDAASGTTLRPELRTLLGSDRLAGSSQLPTLLESLAFGRHD